MRVVVIGSGIGGASVAYHLVKLGVDVVVVDAGVPGTATAAGAGIVSPKTSPRPGVKALTTRWPPLVPRTTRSWWPRSPKTASGTRRSPSSAG